MIDGGVANAESNKVKVTRTLHTRKL